VKNSPESSKPMGEMVTRFLGWRLPEDFRPDGGVTFTPINHPACWPVGTNLLTATQAQAMLEHVIKPAMDALYSGEVRHVLKLLSDGEISVAKAHEWIWDYVRDGKLGTLPCLKPPPGWTCSRAEGHEGPCAASPRAADETPATPELNMVNILATCSYCLGDPDCPWCHGDSNPNRTAAVPDQTQRCGDIHPYGALRCERPPKHDGAHCAWNRDDVSIRWNAPSDKTT
jgi:hypothetical protein